MLTSPATINLEGPVVVVPIPILFAESIVKPGAVVPVDPPTKCNLASETKTISPIVEPVVN